MKWKITFSLLIILVILLIITGCVQKPVPDAIINCNRLLTTNWNEGFKCVLDIGDKIQDIDDCNKLNNLESSQGQLTDFQSLCMNNVAISKKDGSLCLKISSFSDKETIAIRNTCLLDIAVIKEEESICSQVKSDEGVVGKGTLEYDLCLSSVATIKKDENLCLEISVADEDTLPLNPRASCLRNIAVAKQDATICEEITHPDYVRGCIETVAIQNKN